MSDDNVVILNNGDDEDSTIFQTTQDREKLLRDIIGDDQEDTSFNTTVQLRSGSKAPYWQQIFG